jgi:hypothetical protein
LVNTDHKFRKKEESIALKIILWGGVIMEYIQHYCIILIADSLIVLFVSVFTDPNYTVIAKGKDSSK